MSNALRIFAVYDKKAMAYATPFYFTNTSEALRAMDNITNDPNSLINKNASDFSLFEIGTYNDATGLISGHVPPIFLQEATAFKKEDK